MVQTCGSKRCMGYPHGMNRARFEKLDSVKQQTLLECAAEEFAEKGFDAASLNRILERAQMSKSSLYYYFDDKADLFASLLERSLMHLLDEVGPFDIDALTAETFWPQCEDAYGRFVALADRNAWHVKLGRLFYRVSSEPAGGPPTDRVFDAGRNWLTELLEKGQSLGVVRSDMPLPLLAECALGIGEALDQWTLAQWATLDEAERQRLAGDHLALFRRLLAP